MKNSDTTEKQYSSKTLRLAHILLAAASAAAVAYGMIAKADTVFLAGIAGAVASYLAIRKRIRESVLRGEKGESD